MVKNIPKWVQDRKEANQPKEVVEFVGADKTSGVIDGKLPNGEPYLWVKRRSEDGKTQYVKRTRS